MPHIFLPDSGHSYTFHWILEESSLAETSAKSTIPGVAKSGGINSFQNWHQNVPRNAQEQNATGIQSPGYLLIRFMFIYTNVSH